MNTSRQYLAFLALVWLSLTGGSAIAAEHHIDVGNFYFSPTGTVVHPGDIVYWHLVEGIHTTTSDPSSPQAWNSGNLANIGGTFSIVIGETLGSYPYHCNFHSLTMKDTLRVIEPPQAFYYFGFLNTALGEAICDTCDDADPNCFRELTVSNIQSTGDDGVSIDLVEAEFGVVTLIDVEPTVVQTIDGVGEVDGSPDQLIGSLTLEGDGASTVYITPDFSPVGATSYTVTVYQDDVMAGSQAGVTGAAASVAGPVDTLSLWPMDSELLMIVSFPSPREILIAPGAKSALPVIGNRLVIIPENPTSTVGYLSDIEVKAAGVASFTIIGEALGIFNTPHRARGGARLFGEAVGIPENVALHVNNFGNSGEDGVEIELYDYDALDRIGLQWQLFDMSTVNSYLDLKAGGLVEGGQTGSEFGSSTVTNVGPHKTIDIDFSPIGATTVTMELYNMEKLIYTWSGLTGTVAEVMFAPLGAAFFNHYGGGGESAVCWGWPAPVMVTIPGGPTLESDKIILWAVDQIDNPETLQHTALLAADINEIILRPHYNPQQIMHIFGLQNRSLGQAILSESGGELMVSNVQSTGEDGVSVDLIAAEAVACSLVSCEPIIVQVAGDVDGESDQMILSLTVDVDETNTAYFMPDFSPVGASSYTVEVYQDDVLMGSQMGVTGVAASAMCPIDGPSIWQMDTDILQLYEFPTQLDFIIAPGMKAGLPVMGNRLIITPESPTSTVGYISEVALKSAEVPSFTIPDEALGMFGLLHHALGQALISGGVGPGLGTLVVRNIQSTGLDGIRVPFHGPMNPAAVVNHYMASWLPLDPGNTLPDGSGLDILMDGALELQTTKAPSGWEIIPDFSGIGAPTHTVNVYLDGAVVEMVAGISGLAATADMAPTGFHAQPDDDEQQASVSFAWDSPAMITLPGVKNAPIAGDMVEVVPENPISTVSPFMMADITAKDIPQVIFTEMSIADLDCCDLPGDANDDASVNVGDAVHIVNYVFKGGPPPPCLNEGDANFDCSINVGDAVYVINYVFKGGPAPGCGCVE